MTALLWPGPVEDSCGLAPCREPTCCVIAEPDYSPRESGPWDRIADLKMPWGPRSRICRPSNANPRASRLGVNYIVYGLTH